MPISISSAAFQAQPTARLKQARPSETRSCDVPGKASEKASTARIMYAGRSVPSSIKAKAQSVSTRISGSRSASSTPKTWLRPRPPAARGSRCCIQAAAEAMGLGVSAMHDTARGGPGSDEGGRTARGGHGPIDYSKRPTPEL